MRTLWLDQDGKWHTKLRGRQILNDPRLNRGTAFSYAERHELGITGLVPPAHVTLDEQVARVYAQYQRQPEGHHQESALVATIEPAKNAQFK